MLVLVDKKLRYNFYRANTVKNVTKDGNEMSQFSTFPCSHRFISNWNSCFIHETFKKHLLLPIYFAESIYFLLERSKKLP